MKITIYKKEFIKSFVEDELEVGEIHEIEVNQDKILNYVEKFKKFMRMFNIEIEEENDFEKEIYLMNSEKLSYEICLALKNEIQYTLNNAE